MGSDKIKKEDEKQPISFHSISFPSEWGEHTSQSQNRFYLGFHSISFPSEWGDQQLLLLRRQVDVSIQLVSPASGEPSVISEYLSNWKVSIQLVSPASGESPILNCYPVRFPEPISEVQIFYRQKHLNSSNQKG